MFLKQTLSGVLLLTGSLAGSLAGADRFVVDANVVHSEPVYVNRQSCLPVPPPAQHSIGAYLAWDLAGGVQCEAESAHLDHYKVTYEYDGREYMMRRTDPPGTSLAIEIQLD